MEEILLYIKTKHPVSSGIIYCLSRLVIIFKYVVIQNGPVGILGIELFYSRYYRKSTITLVPDTRITTTMMILCGLGRIVELLTRLAMFLSILVNL